MCVQTFSSSAVLVLHAYMHGAGASSLDSPPLAWRIQWTALQVKGTEHVQGAHVSAGAWVFQPELTDGVIGAGGAGPAGTAGAAPRSKLLKVRKADLGNVKWVCERLVLLSWEQVRCCHSLDSMMLH